MNEAMEEQDETIKYKDTFTRLGQKLDTMTDPNKKTYIYLPTPSYNPSKK